MTKMPPRLHAFLKDESATLSVEAALVFPILLWAYAGMYVFWDAFKMQNINVKAAYTISDMISREITDIQPQWVDGLSVMLDFLNRTKYDTRLRVSVVGAYEEDDGSIEYQLCWSEGRDGMEAHTNMENIEQVIPIMAAGREVIVVETEMDYVPLIPAPYGVAARTFSNTIVTSPRFASGGIGLMNGDGTVRECTFD